MGHMQTARVSLDNFNPNKQLELLVIVNRTESAAHIRLELAGRMTANGIGELRREVDEARRRRKTIRLDFSEVTLLDRVSAEFLNSVAGPQVVFENCPVYMHRWIQGARRA
jgi:hypothetical protein